MEAISRASLRTTTIKLYLELTRMVGCNSVNLGPRTFLLRRRITSGEEKERVNFCSQAEENGSDTDANGGQVRWLSVLESGVVVVRGRGDGRFKIGGEVRWGLS